MARKKRIFSLTLAIDMGGSLTKAVATDEEGKHCFVAIAPEIQPVNDAQIAHYENYSFGADKTIDWVEHNGDKYVFGKTARNIFQAYNNLRKLKSDSNVGIPKVLAVIHLIAQHYSVQELSLNLGILLPSTEFISGSKNIFIDNLESALSCFTTNTGQIKIELKNSITCYPEGAGAYSVYVKECADVVKNKTLGVVTMGYRNVNFFSCSQGVIGGYKSNDLGFSQIVHEVGSYLGTENSGHLASALFDAGVNVNPSPLQAFLGYYQQNAQINLNQLQNHTKNLINDYMKRLSSWFSLCFDYYPNRILFLGGSVDYFKPVLPTLFPSQVELVFHPGYRPQQRLLNDSSVISDIRGLNTLDARLIDVWSFFLFLLDKEPNFRVQINSFLENKILSFS